MFQIALRILRCANCAIAARPGMRRLRRGRNLTRSSRSTRRLRYSSPLTSHLFPLPCGAGALAIGNIGSGNISTLATFNTPGALAEGSDSSEFLVAFATGSSGVSERGRGTRETPRLQNSRRRKQRTHAASPPGLFRCRDFGVPGFRDFAPVLHTGRARPPGAPREENGAETHLVPKSIGQFLAQNRFKIEFVPKLLTCGAVFARIRTTLQKEVSCFSVVKRNWNRYVCC